jgi:hypothetical protein
MSHPPRREATEDDDPSIVGPNGTVGPIGPPSGWIPGWLRRWFNGDD